MKKWIIVISLCLVILGIYKVSFTAHAMSKAGIGFDELKMNYKPIPSEINITPPTCLSPSYVTNGIAIAFDSPVKNEEIFESFYSCEMDGAQLRFMVLAKRENLVGTLPGHEHLSTDQILDEIYNTDPADLLSAFTPRQILRSAALLRLKSLFVVGQCEQEWHSFYYAGQKAFAAVGPQVLCIDIPSTNGEFYAHLLFYRPDTNTTIKDISILNKILITGDSNKEF